jgi:hypothetical protein
MSRNGVITESRKELDDFTEHTIVENYISMWTYDIEQDNKNIVHIDTLKKILRVYVPT